MLRPDHKELINSIKQFKKDFFSNTKNANIFKNKQQEFHEGILELSRLIDNFLRVSFDNNEDDCGGNLIMANILKEKREEMKVKYNKFAKLHDFTANPKAVMNKELDLDSAKQVPIPEIMGVNYKRDSGRVQMFCCPLHNEKTPSFAWYPKDNRWYCFGACVKGGDSIDLFMELNNCDFITAVKELNKY
jgi:hypothetical protein